MLVYTGILDSLQSDDELAVILGHEIGHYIAREYQGYELIDGVLLL